MSMNNWDEHLSHPINASVQTPEAITKDAVCLHNFLRLTNSAIYCPNGFVYSEETVDNLNLESGVLKC